MLDLVAKRYGQRPSSLLPAGTISTEASLWFDVNIALKGLVAENTPAQTPKDQSLGKINTRSKFVQIMNRAKADIANMAEARSRLRTDA